MPNAWWQKDTVTKLRFDINTIGVINIVAKENNNLVWLHHNIILSKYSGTKTLSPRDVLVVKHYVV